MREESVRLRAQSERLRSERSSLQQKLQEMETSLFDSRDEFRRLNEVLKVEREQWSMEHISSKLLTSELTREVDMLRQSSKQQQQQEQSYRSETKLEPIRSSSIDEELSASETRIQDMEDEIKALKQENNGWLNNFFFLYCRVSDLVLFFTQLCGRPMMSCKHSCSLADSRKVDLCSTTKQSVTVWRPNSK